MAKLLGQLSGHGRAFADDDEVGTVGFEIDVWAHPGSKSADGRLHGAPGAVTRLAQARKATLELESGDRVEFSIPQADLANGTGRILVNGRVPGF